MKASHLFLILATFVATAGGQSAFSHIRIAPSTAEKLLIHRVEPVFKNPPMAARVTGTVVAEIEIGTTGTVERARLISGPRLLSEAVLNAVRKYKYKPYLLNGKPVSVGSTVSVTCSNE